MKPSVQLVLLGMMLGLRGLPARAQIGTATNATAGKFSPGKTLSQPTPADFQRLTQPGYYAARFAPTKQLVASAKARLAAEICDSYLCSFVPTTDLTPTLYARPSSLNAAGPVTVVVDVDELNEVASSGLITLQISKDASLPLRFSASTTSLNGRVVNNSQWQFDGQSNEDYYLLTTTASIAGGGQLSVGLSGSWQPGPTSGVMIISAVVRAGSGGELKLTNNTDADKIEYF